MGGKGRKDLPVSPHKQDGLYSGPLRVRLYRERQWHQRQSQEGSKDEDKERASEGNRGGQRGRML